MAKGKKTGGRVAGVANKATSQARGAIAAFVDGNADRLSGWLDEIYQKDGPKDAFNAMTSLLEYHVPKLARNEMTGAGGKDLIPNEININLRRPSGD